MLVRNLFEAQFDDVPLLGTPAVGSVIANVIGRFVLKVKLLALVEIR